MKKSKRISGKEKMEEPIVTLNQTIHRTSINTSQTNKHSIKKYIRQPSKDPPISQFNMTRHRLDDIQSYNTYTMNDRFSITFVPKNILREKVAFSIIILTFYIHFIVTIETLMTTNKSLFSFYLL